MPNFSRQLENRMARINSEDFSLVKLKVRKDLRLMGKDVDEKYLDSGILALKQYYAIVLFDPFNMHAISSELDVFWHSHILHTYQYVEFCQEVYGCYIHHIPLDKRDEQAVNYVASVYDYTSEKMRVVFSNVCKLFHPRKLSRAELVCLHGCASDELIVFDQEIMQSAVFPKNEDLRKMCFFLPKKNVA